MQIAIINDKIKILKFIGKGASGKVFLGKNIITNKFYAIKKINKKELEIGNNYQYLTNEISILRRLNHPNILKIEEIIEYKADYYILYEYYNGGTLQDSLKYYLEKYSKPLQEKIVRFFVYNILMGIIYLNNNNIVHRDIKSNNILLHYEKDEDLKSHNFLKAEIKIIDFGYARYLKQNELAKSLVGTPLYMEPKLLRYFSDDNIKVTDGFYDKKVDVWSLGVLTYELLMGTFPFYANNLKDLCKCVNKRCFIVPEEKNRNFQLSEAAILFIDKTLNKDNNLRPLPEDLVSDQWIIGFYDNNILFEMKKDLEIAKIKNVEKFQEFWKISKAIKKKSKLKQKSKPKPKLKQKPILLKQLSFFSPQKNIYSTTLANIENWDGGGGGKKTKIQSLLRRNGSLLTEDNKYDKNEINKNQSIETKEIDILNDLRSLHKRIRSLEKEKNLKLFNIQNEIRREKTSEKERVTSDINLPSSPNLLKNYFKKKKIEHLNSLYCLTEKRHIKALRAKEQIIRLNSLQNYFNKNMKTTIHHVQSNQIFMKNGKNNGHNDAKSHNFKSPTLKINIS